MLALSVLVEVHPEFTDKYREAVIRHAYNTLTKEEGCVHFAVHEHVGEPDRFFLYEAYQSGKDLKEVHEKAPYFKEFQILTSTWVKNVQINLWKKTHAARQ